jgi:hypothetical protein
VRYVSVALLLLPSVLGITRAAEPPASFSEPAAVLFNVSERDLNRIIVDSFRANGGPRFDGEKERVSSSVAGLRYRALFSDPVIRLGKDGTARLSMDIMNASLRIGRLERDIGGVQAQCEGAGLDVDPGRPLAVEMALDLTIENGALRVFPKSVEIPEAGERLRLVEPARCKNTLLPRWFLWGLGAPYLRHSFGNLDDVILKRARASAARLEKKESLLTTGWEFPKSHAGDPSASLHLFAETLDMSGGSLLVGLTAASARPTVPTGPPRRLDSAGSIPSGSFLGLSESFANELARRITSDPSRSHRRSDGNFRKLRASNAVYALVPGLRKLDSKDNVVFEVDFPTAPRLEFRRFDEGGPASKGSQALIRVLLSGMEINIRKNDGGRKTLLGTLHVDSGRMAVVPFANVLGGVSFRIVENEWHVSSKGLQFDEDLVAATLQELTFGKIFATSDAPLLLRALHVGGTEFLPKSFAVNGSYLVIGLGEPQPSEGESPAVAAKQTGTLLGSR